MNKEHTQGRITFKEDGDANHWSMLSEDGRWWLSLLANGEQTTELQIANLRRLAACWNACDGLDTYFMEHVVKQRIANRLVEYSELVAQRDQLLKALTDLASVFSKDSKEAEILAVFAAIDACKPTPTGVCADQN